MAWIKHNPNPRGKQVGDCAVRAISTALGKSWDDAYIEMSLVGLTMADMPSANSVTTSYLRKNGFRRTTVTDDCTVADFCKRHSNGTYVLGLGDHLVAVRDGDHLDSWDSGNEIPLYYFEKGD